MTGAAMDEARFTALAEAYGGDIGRWPADARAAALSVVDRSWAQAILGEAARLDAWLDLSPAPGVATTLLDRALANAPRGKALARRRLIWSGIGFGGVGLAGAAAAMLTMAVLPPPAYRQVASVDLSDEDTVFGGIGRGEN